MTGQDAELWWVLDAYPDRRTNQMVLWLTGPQGAKRLRFGYLPEFYIQAGERDMERAKRYFATGSLYESEMVDRRLVLGSDRLTGVLKVTPRTLGFHLRAARAADFFGGYGRFRFYNLDIDLAQRFLAEQGLFPLARVRYPSSGQSGQGSGVRVRGSGNGTDDSVRRHPAPCTLNPAPSFPNSWCDLVDNRLSIHYLLPRLRVAELAVSVRKRGLLPSNEDALVSASLCGDEFSGTEEDILGGLVAALRRRDPDVILTDGGDSFVLPYLYHRARLLGLEGFHLGREGQSGSPSRKEKSHFSYGRILYRPAAYYLRGRLHIDRSSSFLFQEGDLEGILELSRLSGIAFQRMARSSPGTAISAMEVNLVLREGGLVAWKKNLPEDFKSMRCLLSTDRGGFIYEPRVGVHERVLEVDFASMYPHIMVIHNISPETVNCGCCRNSKRKVPGIGYWTCEKRLGLIPKILEPLVRRRMELKRLKKRPGDRWDRRSRVLKPLLVTCFGYTGYKNAPFGRIECHEAINAHGREILLESARIAERRGFEVVHGIVDSMWLKGPLEKKRELIAEIAKASGIPLSEEGVYKWLVFLPNKCSGEGALNRYFGLFENDELKLRGIALRKHDTPGLVRGLEAGMLEVFSKARDAAGFMEQIPGSIDVLRRFAGRVLDGGCSPGELILTRRVSRSVDEYVQFNDTFCALKRLGEEGLKVPPGDTVKYIVIDGAAREPGKRTVPVQLLEHRGGGKLEYDRGFYHKLLLRAAEEMLAPFGYDMERLDRILKGNDAEQVELGREFPDREIDGHRSLRPAQKILGQGRM